MGKQVHLSPGWNVGFLYYLEKAEIDRSMRACWWVYTLDPYDYWCDCWAGLNGLLMKDGETPQPSYWIWLRYAQMENECKLNVMFTDVYTNVIATRNSSSNIVKLLIGRYLKTTPNDVTINVYDYSFAENALMVVEKVPNDPDFYLDPPIAKAMPDGPELVVNEIVDVIDDSILFNIYDYVDGDAYIITIYPPPSKPNISGQISGKLKIKYYYNFLSESAYDSDIYFYIDWGDGSIEEWVGPFSSGEKITISHTWGKNDIYIIKAKCKDTSGLESDWSTLEVSIPKNKPFIYSFKLISWLFERFPNLFPIMRQMMGV
jgi:hypothetical protein